MKWQIDLQRAALVHSRAARLASRLARRTDRPAPPVANICVFAALGDPCNPHVPGLGDLIARSVVVRLLRRRYPGARISLVAGPRLIRRFHEFLVRHAYIDELIECPEMGGGSLRAWAGFFWRMRRRRIDLCVVDPSSVSIRAVHAYACGIRERIGVPADAVEARLLTRPVLVRPEPGRRADLLDILLGYAGALGVEVADWRRELLPQFPFTRARRVERSGAPVVAVHAGGDPHWNRRWPLERYEEICRRLCADVGAAVYLVGGPDERPEHRRIVDFVKTACPTADIVDRCGGSLEDTANDLERSTLFVGNDSAPMHIAVALGKPVVVLSGPGRPLIERMYPGIFVSLHRACQHAMPFAIQRHYERRRSCLEFECPYSYDRERPAYPRCLADIGVEEVWSAIAVQLAGPAHAAGVP